MEKNGGNYVKEKGQFSVSTMFSFLFLILFFYIWLAVAIPILDNYVYPLLEGLPYGDLIQLMFQLGPLMIAILIFIYPYMESKWRAQAGPPGYGY